MSTGWGGYNTENYNLYGKPEGEKNMGPHGISVEQLVDIVQQDLTFSGMFPKILPDKDIKRIIREIALPWFYRNYRFSVQKSYFFLGRENLTNDLYTRYKYFIFPEEVENITKIVRVDNPSLFRLGIQAPHLSINLGVTNQPFLTSFVTTVGELGTYRSILSAFASELNKLNRPTLKFNFNHINKRLHILTDVTTDLMLEIYLRIEPDELFNNELFKEYIIGYSRIRMADAILRFNFNMPGEFNYNASEIKTSGKEMYDSVIEKIKGQTTSDWFFMSK
ncbi:MAG: hypothetical protein ACOCP8_09640 [archaeon]